MNKALKYTAFLYILLLFGCGKNSDYAIEEGAGVEFSMMADEKAAEDIIERKLIKEGTVEFETDDIQATRKTILEAIDKSKGYISADREYKSTGRLSNTLEIRVPAAKFDDLVADAIRGVEKLDNKEITIRDVTEEFVDVEARLKTKMELEARYRDILKEAKNVTEILAIEKQIGDLRSDIESVEGRLNYLQNRVSFSTLSITFYESIPSETEFGKKFKDGFGNGWDNVIWFFVFLINVWPFILILIAFIIGRRIYKRRK